MKKLFGLIFILGIFTSVQAQFSNELIFGLNATQIGGDNLAGFNQIGLKTGVSSVIGLRNGWKARIELTYSQKGSRRPVKADDPNARDKFFIRVNYFEIPILGEFTLNKNLSVLVGPTIGYLLSAKVVSGITEQDQSDQYFKFDYSVLTGFHYAINERTNVALRFSNSILPINIGTTNTLRNFYNTTTSITFRYIFLGLTRN
ncbi:MAG: hypothetical protein ACI81S_001769 [Sphingobacteriales bacterium]|jgi:hypothetical protein